MVGVLFLVFVMGLTPGLQASVCDEDPPNPYPMKFRPVLIVGSLVDYIMDWYLSEVGGALPEEMDIEYFLDPEDPDNFNVYGHTLFLHMSDVEGELTESTVLITSEVGLVTVRINVPGLSSHVDIIDVVNEESCGPWDVICQIENGIFDLLPGLDFGLTIDESSSYIEQTAEVCVLPNCTVAHPLLDTTVNLEGVSTQIIEESDVPQWIWDLDTFDIIRGIAVCMGMKLIEVPGATGYIDTDYAGKGRAAVDALDDYELVVAHIEAPDEAGHLGDADEKVLALERVDEHVVGPLLEAVRKHDDWRMLVIPDHPTPVSTRAHSAVPPPWCYAGSDVDERSGRTFCEREAQAGGLMIDPGHTLIDQFMGAGCRA